MKESDKIFRLNNPYAKASKEPPAAAEFSPPVTIQATIDSLSDFIKSILHGLTTPYAALTGYMNLVLNEAGQVPGCLDGEDFHSLLEGIQKSQESFEGFVGKLRLFAEPLNLTLNSASMIEFVGSIIDDPDTQINKKRKISFVSKVKSGQDYAEIDYSFLNLALKSILQAISTAPGGRGLVRVRLERTMSPETPNLWETIASHGAPMEKGFFRLTIQDSSGAWRGRDLSGIFLPYYAEEDRPHEIDRLDLPIAYQIIRAHDGFFRISETQDNAFLLMVYLPE